LERLSCRTTQRPHMAELCLPATRVCNPRCKIRSSGANSGRSVRLPILNVRYFPFRERILVGDLSEVVLNLRQFNLDVATDEGRELFGRRTVTYFVVDPKTEQFAPSKFCAYAAIPQITSAPIGDLSSRFHAEMTVALYANLDETDHNFDGRIARLHLEKRLGMNLQQLDDVPGLKSAFAAWLAKHQENITVHRGGAQFLLPPAWF
jgi:hypothetical protein